MKVRKLNHVYVVEAKTQYELAISFMRLQEFYESSFPEIQGNHFTFEQYMDRYAEEFGDFSYTSDWDGFNIPGHVVIQFFKIFTDLSDHEKELKSFLEPALNIKKKTAFYVIGIHNNAALDHEIAHAMYYITLEYTSTMNAITDTIPKFIYNRMKKVLLKMGYCDNVIRDEIQAYLATSSRWYILRTFGCLPLNTMKKAKVAFLNGKRRLKQKIIVDGKEKNV
jgi:hypothetical protein